MDIDLKTEVLKVLMPLVSTLGMAFLAWAVSWLREIAKKYIATTRYAQEMGILYDACKTVLAKKAKEKKIRYLDMVKDFHLDPKEVEEIKKDIIEVANDSLKNLRGYVMDEGAKRIASRLDFLLGELQFQVIASLTRSPGTAPSDSEEETDPLANTPAS